jgi:hypothetical protein
MTGDRMRIPRLLPALGALAIAISGGDVGAAHRSGPSMDTNQEVTVSTATVAPRSVVPVSMWQHSGDEDAADGRPIDDGYAPPGAEGVAGIDFRGTLPWQIANPVTDTSYIWAHATKSSYLPGQTIELKVSTTEPTFEVSLWRYNNTGLADQQPFALVTRQTGLTGVVGAAATMDEATHMVKAHWAGTAQIDIQETAPSGVYMLRLSSSTNIQSYVPIVVRKAAAAKYLYVVPSMTWQAYNVWGGTSLYQSLGIPSAMIGGPPRAQAVSYDRPYLSKDGFPLFGAEDMVIISFLQRSGYDVAYTTDTDLSTDPSTQPLPRAVIIGGHSEYWSTRMYDWLSANINTKGTFGLASFGANSGFWACTMLDDGRTQRCLKRGEVKLASGNDTLRYMKRPEQAIFGTAFGVITVGGGPVRLSASAAATGLLKGTGLRWGSSLGQIGGYEVDQVHAASQCGVLKCRYDVRFATSTIRQRFVNCACPYNVAPNHGHSVVRRLPSGRRVFAAGTLWWGYGLDPVFAAKHGVPAGFPRLMANILAYVAR